MEISINYYNSSLNIGLNDWKKVYDFNTQSWLSSKYHLGRLVYGNQRLSYTKVKTGLVKKKIIIKEYCPF